MSNVIIILKYMADINGYSYMIESVCTSCNTKSHIFVAQYFFIIKACEINSAHTHKQVQSS